LAGIAAIFLLIVMPSFAAVMAQLPPRRPLLVNLQQLRTYRGRKKLAANIVIGLALGLTSGIASGLLYGLAAGFAVWLTVGLTAGLALGLTGVFASLDAQGRALQ
jgi:hypothetical protein